MPRESEATLDALMGRLALGERSAFEPLFRALYPRALRAAAVRLPASSAADAAQAALLRLFARAHRFTPGRPVLPWFYTLVGHEIAAVQRQAARDARLLDAAEEPSVESGERELLDRELSRALELAIESLDHVSAAAIRAQLGLGAHPELEPATFRKRVSRAYARLRLLLGEYR